ncbi:MAG: type VI secretion system protein TssA [Paludibacterium sp.]|uniref:type VI secretion system protein TssA n=1 Tax=Paludibacterium sp. TaxID=1917523 RepID=UPI0025DB87E1|nr:type VI secretion system protein TssA [Paludibacterium sp.]MBV8049407.1 type VI secretion system protein TssA [Paludibacterium sp.]MBV8646811.1 type VI secretion system protein TssA [Paludibacterium sp.]
MEATQQHLDALLAPVSDAAPAGEDLSYDLLFDEIREARRSDDPTLAQGEWEREIKNADWRRAARLCEQGLRERGKDLQLVVWYGEARAKLDGFAGAAAGLQLLEGWLAHYWESGFPPLDPHDLDERVSKIEWYAAQLAHALRMTPLTAPQYGGYSWLDWKTSREVENQALKDADARKRALAEGKLDGDAFDKSVTLSGLPWFKQLAADIQRAWSSYQTLDQQSMERFGDDFPSLAELWRALSDCREVVERLMQQQFGLNTAEKEPDMTPTTPVVTAAPAVPASSAPMAVAPIGSLQSRADAVRALREVAGYFRQHEPHSPVAGLAERAARWAEMPLEEWLAHVIKDESTLRQLHELLDVKPKQA